MLDSYSTSIAPGTAANRLTQAKTYISFAVMYQFDPLKPTSSQLCMYLQYLRNSFAAPTTVKNYLSGARTWMGEHGGDVSPFSTLEYHQLSSGLTKRSSHLTKRAAPLGWKHIQIIISFVDSTPGVPLAVKPCILIGFHTFLRSSNLLSPTMSSWGGPHTLAARDLMLSDRGLDITVHSTKTKSDPKPVQSTIPWSSDSHLCTALAWFKYASKIQPWALGPAFLTDQRVPLTARHVVGFMRLALRDSKDLDPARISLHSLRRGATQEAAQQGLSLPALKDRGMWRSDSGIAPYLL